MAIELDDSHSFSVAAVIPCYREVDQVLALLSQIDDTVDSIFVIDDACPDGTGDHVEKNATDPRINVVRLKENLGVGGATLTGYRHAIDAGYDIIVKLDGDGQMDPRAIPKLVRPLISGRADYTKGNRFYNLDNLSLMPKLRVFGNLALSFASKMSSGYWNIFDPTNGFTAIHSAVAKQLPLEKINKGYFFESDMLFRLNIARAVVVDVPIPPIYGDEQSSLRISKILWPFLRKHASNLCRRIFYSYFLRDFSVASIELIIGVAALTFSLIFGGIKWYASAATGIPTPTGSIMLAALTFIVGTQLLISFLNFDTQNQPTSPLIQDL